MNMLKIGFFLLQLSSSYSSSADPPFERWYKKNEYSRKHMKERNKEHTEGAWGFGGGLMLLLRFNTLCVRLSPPMLVTHLGT